jgi:cyclohexanone monooxygenase
MGANIPGKPRVSLMYIGGFQNYSRQCDVAAVNGYEGFLLSDQKQPVPTGSFGTEIAGN